MESIVFKILDSIKKSSFREMADTPIWEFSNDPDFEEDEGWNLIESVVGNEIERTAEEQMVIQELDEAFRAKLKPFPEEGEYKTVYCRLYKKKETLDGEVLLFSALTEEMIEADREYFKKDKEIPYVIDMLYKPYFYELTVNESPEGMKEEDAWYKVTVSIDGNDHEKKAVQYGQLSFSASPYISKKVAINKWEKLIGYNKQDYEVLTASDIVDAGDPEIENILKPVFENVQRGTISVFKYGEANFIKGTNVVGKSNREYIFDCGFPTEYCLKKCSNNDINWSGSEVIDDVSKIGGFNPEIIFITHWHQDHYKAGFMFGRGVYMGTRRAIWIAAHYDVNSDNDYSADRLVRYLINNNAILFVRNGYSGCTVGETRLVRGNRYTYTYNGNNKADLNNSCLMLQTGNTLLSGDCDFEFWPDEFGQRINTDIKNIAVPHHAASTTNKLQAQNRIKSIIPSDADRNAALVCTGYNEFVPKHPDEAVINLYSGLGFQVLSTNDATAITEIDI